MKKIIFGLFLSLIISLPVISDTKYSNLTNGISQISLMKKYKNINLISVNKLKKETYKLTQEDKYVIIKYVMGAVKGEDSFLLTNCYLRGNLDKYISKKDITKPLQCRLKFYADSLMHTVSKTKLPQNTILYYSMNDKDAAAVLPNTGNSVISQPASENNLSVLRSKLLNKEYTEKGFMLTYYDKISVPKTKFRFEINAPKNLQAVYIDEVTKKDNKQVLINSGYKWKITNIELLSNPDKSEYYLITLKLLLN